MELPIMKSLWLYHPTGLKWVAWTFIILFPIGLPLYLFGIRSQANLKEEIEHINTTSNELIALLKVNTDDITA